MEILVFKTNIRNKRQVNIIKPFLKNIEDIREWNVDLQDIDKILRIESIKTSAKDIESIITKAGFECQELID